MQPTPMQPTVPRSSGDSAPAVSLGDAARSSSAPGLSPVEADALLAEAVLTDDGRQSPYGLYRRLRHGLGRWDSATGATVVTSYADSMELMRDPRLGRFEDDMERPLNIGGRSERTGPATKSMLMLNPPDHTRIRSLVSRAFTPRRVQSLRPAIEGALNPLLDHIADEGSGDLLAEVASEFPITVISELLGVPRSLARDVQPLVRSVTAFIDSAASDEEIDSAEVASEELAVIFDELVEVKRNTPDEHLLSAMIVAEEAGDRLTHEELIVNTILLYAAGFETTTNLIGNGTLLLLDNPDQMQLLRSNRQLMGSAVMEMLRADSPVQMNVRVALEPVELFDRPYERGATFIILMGAGNHDESVYADADGFLVERFTDAEAAVPLSFGWGAHHCPGSHLARAEGEIFFSSLLDRFTSIELDRDALGGQRPRFRSSFTLRGLEALPLNLVAA